MNTNTTNKQVAIVTGASSGIGLGITRALTKSTIPAFNRALAMEFLADDIRANTISLGVVDTSMHANDDHKILKKRQPFPRLVEISEIVDALLYLQSAPSDFITKSGRSSGIKCPTFGTLIP
jgi:NAD(P)-dependent dehydrogenase (short-subunit alcohol dehydrogenase family)